MEAPEETEKNQNQEARTFFSSIFVFALIFSLVTLLTSCTGTDPQPACDTFATVREYSGLDGCGKVLVLDNGEVLLPVWSEEASALTGPNGTSLTSYIHSLPDGQRISISYKEATGFLTACMAGKTVHLLCVGGLNEEVGCG